MSKAFSCNVSQSLATYKNSLVNSLMLMFLLMYTILLKKMFMPDQLFLLITSEELPVEIIALL